MTGSIIDLGTDNIVVHAQVDSGQRDRYNEPIYTSTDYPLRVTVQPVTVDERESLDNWSEAVYAVYSRTWPAGAKSTITWLGREWDQVGEAERFVAFTPDMAYFRALIRAKDGVA